jgi:hypothetical protein
MRTEASDRVASPANPDRPQLSAGYQRGFHGRRYVKADAKDQISGIKDLPASQLTEGTSRPRRVL